MRYNLGTLRFDNRANWWLRVPSGVSSSDVCYVSAYGIANDDSAASTWIYPLPCFHIG